MTSRPGALPDRTSGSGPVFLVADFLHPVDGLAVDVFQNGDVRHGLRRRGAVPVLLARRAPDHIARANLFFRATLALHPSASFRDDQGLPERMRVPRRAGARPLAARLSPQYTRLGRRAWSRASCTPNSTSLGT